jgi:hypothetical protein
MFIASLMSNRVVLAANMQLPIISRYGNFLQYCSSSLVSGGSCEVSLTPVEFAVGYLKPIFELALNFIHFCHAL